MKVAYITLHKVRNYGSVLQTYAARKVLENLGHEPILIDYCPPRFVESNRADDEFRRFRYKRKNNPIIKALFYAVTKRELNRLRKRFERFLSQALPRKTKPYFDIEELRVDPPVADVYCTGSDQVWNFKTNGFYERPFYLDFGDPSTRRVAFAASFGRSELEPEEMEAIRETLGRYYAIGVRESSGLPILERLGVERRANLLDPTLALDESEWWKTTSDVSPFKEKYILVYEFNKTSDIGAYARKLSAETGLPVKRIAYYGYERHKGERCVVAPSVNKFLTLIRHAEYVITNSFHATVFSTVFQRKFAAVYPASFSARLADFLELTGMSERHFDDPEKIGEISRPIDFERVGAKLAEEREKTLTFLQKAIEGNL